MIEPMSTERYLVLSALGPDRPGLVAEVTDYLTERGVNIEDSRMAIMGAEFGILVLVSGSESSLHQVESERAVLEQKTKLAVTMRPTKSPEQHRRAAVIPCVVTAEALDHEGIVRAVAVGIARLGINIVSVETASYNAPVTGSPLFRLEVHVDLPRDVSLAQLRAQMAEVARAENLEIDVRSLV
jgi:glycine cleavage system transcriptional repressor